jgi:hypothetical protein
MQFRLVVFFFSHLNTLAVHKVESLVTNDKPATYKF